MSTLNPTFKFPGSEDDVVLEDILALPSRDFVADDLMVGVSVLTGLTTSGYIRTGVVTEVIHGVGIRFDNPDQNGIFWSQMWQHLGDCECPVCSEHMPRVLAHIKKGEEAAAAAASTYRADGRSDLDDFQPNGSEAVCDSFPPSPQLRRTDSGSDYGFNGYPDCEFWERSGYAPLFVATSADYTGSSFLADSWSRDAVAKNLREVNVAEFDEPTRRAYDRQLQEIQDAADLFPTWGGCVPPFMEQALTPPRTLRAQPLTPPRAAAVPAVCPGAPARLRHRRQAALDPLPIGLLEETKEEADESFEAFLRAPVGLRVPMWSLFAGLLALSVYMFMVVWQLEHCKQCLRRG
jgi:hypothetical protein